ncbi:MAG TPA: acyltransferase [Verrucomicrobiae bacterium]
MNKLLAPGIFRSFLAMVVVLHHFWVISFGGWAVYVFFILSGFWITEVWVHKYSRQPRPYLRFISNRYVRLVPVYLACFFIAAIVLRFTSKDYSILHEQAQHPLWWIKLVAIVPAASHAAFLPPLWSIVVEMQFYLIAPLLIWMATYLTPAGEPQKFTRKQALAFAIFLPLMFYSLNIFLESKVAFLPGFLFCFLLGILTSTSGYKPGKKIALVSIGIVLLTALLSLMVPALHQLFGPDAARTSNEYWYLMNRYACAVLGLVTVPYIAYSVRLPSQGLDRELGNFSYPLYLFHFSVVFLFDNVGRLAKLPYWPRTAAALLVVLIGSLAVYWIIDRPAEKWRRKHLEA